MTGILNPYQYTLMIISRQVPLRMRNVSDKSCRRKFKKICVQNFFNRAIYLIMCKKISTAGEITDKNGSCAFHVEYLRLQTRIFGICNTVACLLQQCLLERAAV